MKTGHHQRHLWSASARTIRSPAGSSMNTGLGGAARTHFWIAPKQELVVVALGVFMPNRPMLKDAIKPPSIKP